MILCPLLDSRAAYATCCPVANNDVLVERRITPRITIIEHHGSHICARNDFRNCINIADKTRFHAIIETIETEFLIIRWIVCKFICSKVKVRAFSLEIVNIFLNDGF